MVGARSSRGGDGPLGAGALRWTANGEAFGTGGTVTTALALGDYTVVLTATDSFGATNTDTALVHIVTNLPPACTIRSPDADNADNADNAEVDKGPLRSPADAHPLGQDEEIVAAHDARLSGDGVGCSGGWGWENGPILPGRSHAAGQRTRWTARPAPAASRAA